MEQLTANYLEKIWDNIVSGKTTRDFLPPSQQPNYQQATMLSAPAFIFI